MDAEKTSIILGPPGTGKTTALIGLPSGMSGPAGIIEQALADGVKPNKIGFVSFTKKAAEEGRSRASAKFNIPEEDLPHFRTLHSMAFKYLGMRRDQVVNWTHIKELGKVLGMDFKGRGEVADGDVYGMNAADRMLFLEGLARNTKRPLKHIWSEAFEDSINWFELERFASALAAFKKSRMLWDYTDMLERFVLANPATFPQFDLLIIDEAQDLSPLQWDAVELLAANAKQVYVAGDDDQCHPPGTRILTGNRGEVPIEDLNAKDSIIYWRRDTHCFHGFKQNMVSCTIGSRTFSGKLIKVNELKVTPDHRMIVRLTNQTQDWHCVYLMRRGNWFRIGQCQVFGPQNQLHVAVRMRLERADGLWILDISKNQNKALILEQSLSASYGLPQICFESKLAKQVFTNIQTKRGALQCLDDFGLLANKPWLTRERAHQKSGGTSIMDMEACNLLPEIMLIPTIQSTSSVKTCKWAQFSLIKEDYSGKVYSLNVPKFHTYVANGIGVHNCIYKWAGADVERFISLPGSVRTLDISYRIPSSVHLLAERISRRITNRRPKSWAPRNEAGSVNWFSSLEEVDMSKGTWLLLARNGYMLNDLENWCMSQGFSFNSVNRDPLKSPALAAIRVWEVLRRGGDESAEQILDCLKYMHPSLVSATLLKRLKADESSRMYGLPELRSLGLKTDKIWHEVLTKISPKERDFFIAARRRGEPLLKEPRIKISTIHASKGGQADNVLLLTDMSYRCYNNMQTLYDDEIRVWYVAATRCRETLNIIMPRTNLSFDV